jgi:OmpA-OmpF porin, OOP family
LTAALRTRRPELWALLDSLAQRPVLSSALQQGALALEIALVRANAPLLGAPSCDDWDNAAVKLAAQLRALADTVVAAPAAPPAVPMVVPPTAPVSPAELRAVPSRVHFAYDQSQLAPASKRVLDALADSLAQYPAVQVYLEGHTDPRGSVAYNAALSQRRVQAVYAYLRSKGLAASRLNTAALGKSKLESTSAAVRDLARNRRVTMRFVAPDGREIPTVVQLDDLQVEPRAPR